MSIDDMVLSAEEQAVFKLRSLYERYGYKKYRMSKFEEYDLYAENKSFLPSGSIITFNDLNGRLLALKPDVTLSIAKNIAAYDRAAAKVYYNENVYRVAPGSLDLREIVQSGVENIGIIGQNEICETIALAAQSLAVLGEKHVLDLSHLGLVAGLIDETGLGLKDREKLAELISDKNMHQLRALCARRGVPDQVAERLAAAAGIYGPFEQALAQAEDLDCNTRTHAALGELAAICRALSNAGCADNLMLDFSFVNNLNYYDGVIFRGFIDGINSPVLAGGSYGNLLRKLGKSVDAIGFAVYLSLLDGVSSPELDPGADGVVNVALPKGRLGEAALDIFERAGYTCPAIHEKNRKLLFEDEQARVRYFWAKPSDVAIYVERGAADLGIVGKDIIDEHCPDVYEMLDVKLGGCRMCVAGKADFRDELDRPLRVATKFPNTARTYYTGMSRDVDIIKLSGSIELAPLLGMSDVIVDIVDTGATLAANGLAPLAEISRISARLVANKAAYRFKQQQIEQIRAALAELLTEDAQ